MNGYSRITHTGLQKSRSSDFSDLILIPNQTAPKSQLPSQTPTMMNNSNTHDLHQSQDPEDGVGEIFGVILGRRYSASSASFHGVSGCEKHSSAAAAAAEGGGGGGGGGGAVKRAFSMRRSSSVTEGYSRIHHQCGCDDGIGEGLGALQRRSSKKKKTNILKACRRLFGF